MANYATLKAAIQDVIKQNGANAITGNILQQSLIAMVESLGAGYQFGGIATPTTAPGTPDQRVFYIGFIPGTYSNMGGGTVEPGTIGVFSYNGSWSTDLCRISGISENVGFPASIETGGYINADGTNGASPQYYRTGYYLPVVPGDILLYSGSVGDSGICIAGYDKDYQFLTVILTYGDYINKRVVVPNGCAYIRACGRNTTYPGINYNPTLSVIWGDLSYGRVFSKLDNEFGVTYFADGGYCYISGGKLHFKNLAIRDAKNKYCCLTDGTHQATEDNEINIFAGQALAVLRQDYENQGYGGEIQLYCIQKVSGLMYIILGGVNSRSAIMGPLDTLCELSEIKQQIKQFTINVEFPRNGYIEISTFQFVGATNYNCTDVLGVRPGDTIVYSGICGASGACIVGYASGVPQILLGNGTYENEQIVIPDDVTQIVMCGRNTSFPAPADPTAQITMSWYNLYQLVNDKVSASDFNGKKYSVMGDSIGTDNDGDTPLFTITANDVGQQITSWITWYDYNNSRNDSPSGTTKTIGGVAITLEMVGTQQTFTPVADDIGKTLGTPRYSYNGSAGVVPWWKILGERLGMVFDSSASWNGNSYTSHEENDNLRKIGYGWHPLQIARLANRDENGNRIAPDIVFLCRGTNDATHTPFAKITTFGDGNDQIPDNDIVNGSDYGFKEALAKTVSLIQNTYPDAKIYICTLSPFRRLGDNTFPMNNTYYTMQAYNKAVKEIAEYMGCNVIDFSKCWTFYNCVSGGFVNSSDFTHPVQKGHNAMCEQAVKDM